MERRRTLGNSSMNGNPDTDPFERLVTRSRWRARALAAIFGGGMVLIWTFVSPPAPLNLQQDLVGVGAAVLGAIGLPSLLFYAEKRTLRHLRPLGPLVVDAGSLWGRATLLLRDGMVLTVAATSIAITCTMVFAADGSVFHPSLEQGIRWTHPWHADKVGVVSKRSGPPDAWAMLDGLRKAVRAYTSVCVVGRLRSLAPGPTAPRWTVSATFVSMFPIPLRVDQLSSKLATIKGLLTWALGAFASPPGAKRVQLRRASSR